MLGSIEKNKQQSAGGPDGTIMNLKIVSPTDLGSKWAHLFRLCTTESLNTIKLSFYKICKNEYSTH